MKIVIDIPEKDYKYIKEHYDNTPNHIPVSTIEYFIANGKPLPEDKYIRRICNSCAFLKEGLHKEEGKDADSD